MDLRKELNDLRPIISAEMPYISDEFATSGMDGSWLCSMCCGDVTGDVSFAGDFDVSDGFLGVLRCMNRIPSVAPDRAFGSSDDMILIALFLYLCSVAAIRYEAKIYLL